MDAEFDQIQSDDFRSAASRDDDRRQAEQPARRYPARLPLKMKNRSIVFVEVDRIDWIQADKDHILVHCGPQTYRTRLAVAAMEAMLDPARFARIHRSTIINLARLREMRPWSTGEYIVILRDGKELTMSRSYRAQVLHRLTRGVA